MNARDWYFFSLTISEIIVRITPMFPFKTPPKHLNETAARKLWENPNPSMEIMVPSSPIHITLFLPPYSESAKRPHKMAVKNCAAGKAACIIPTWEAMVESGRDGLKDFS